MKKIILSLIVSGLLISILSVNVVALTLATQPLASSQKVLNTTATSTTAANAVTFAYRAKQYSCKGRDGYTFHILSGTSTLDAYYTITASEEYKSPVGVTLSGFSFMALTVPSTMETIYYY